MTSNPAYNRHTEHNDAREGVATYALSSVVDVPGGRR